MNSPHDPADTWVDVVVNLFVLLSLLGVFASVIYMVLAWR